MLMEPISLGTSDCARHLWMLLLLREYLLICRRRFGPRHRLQLIAQPLDSNSHELAAGARPEFGEQPLDSALDGAFRGVQFGGDLLVAVSFENTPQHHLLQVS